MPTVRADWHIPVLALELADPFAEAPTRIEEVGVPISLAEQRPELQRELIELVNQEAALEAIGITCPIKARADTCCHACPGREKGPRAPLCRVGVRQELVGTNLAVAGLGGQR